MKPTAYEGAEPFIFASYAHKDDAAVYEVLDELQRRGYRLWYDDGIEPGSEWPEDIARHLDEAAVMLAFITPAAVDSSNCRREINYALQREKPFLAVVLEPTEMSRGMEMQLSTQQMVMRQNFDRWDQFIGKILRYPKLESCCFEQQSAGNAQDAPPKAAAGAASAAPRQVRVSFDPSGAVGIGSAVAVVRPGEPVLCPNLGPYARPGLLPVAWCEAPDGTGPCHAPGSPVAFARDTILYVKWRPLAQTAPASAMESDGGTGGGAKDLPKRKRSGPLIGLAIGILLLLALLVVFLPGSCGAAGQNFTSATPSPTSAQTGSGSANGKAASGDYLIDDDICTIEVTDVSLHTDTGIFDELRLDLAVTNRTDDVIYVFATDQWTVNGEKAGNIPSIIGSYNTNKTVNAVLKLTVTPKNWWSKEKQHIEEVKSVIGTLEVEVGDVKHSYDVSLSGTYSV